MKAHIITVRIDSDVALPYWIGGRATAILRAEVQASKEQEFLVGAWIDCHVQKFISQTAFVMYFSVPNVIDGEHVLSAVNRAIRHELPQISNNQWDSLLFASIPLMNQSI